MYIHIYVYIYIDVCVDFFFFLQTDGSLFYFIFLNFLLLFSYGCLPYFFIVLFSVLITESVMTFRNFSSDMPQELMLTHFLCNMIFRTLLNHKRLAYHIFRWHATKRNSCLSHILCSFATLVLRTCLYDKHHCHLKMENLTIKESKSLDLGSHRFNR